MNRKGFTLIELLATIIVLSLVLGLGIYFGFNAINNAKEKTYKVTLNNIMTQSNNYLKEYSDKLFFLATNDGNEYQCITIQDLIDTGYFDKNITESSYYEKDKKVSEGNFIYIERNIDTKVVSKILYNPEDAVDKEVCKNAATATADIRFFVSPDDWSPKKTVTITYILKNKSNVSGYKYGSGKDSNSLSYETELIRKETVSVSDTNKTIYASVLHEDDVVASKDITIDKFDTTKPTKPDIKTVDHKNFSYSSTDTESGIKGYYVSTNNSVPHNDTIWESATSYEVDTSTSKTSTYYVYAIDNVGNISDASKISTYEITRNQGTGSTLTIRYDSKSFENGTELTEDTIMLAGTSVWAKATANTGYNSPILKHGSTTMTSSGSTFMVNATETISSTATANTATVTIKKDGNNYTGLTLALYQSRTSKYTSPSASNGVYTFNTVVNGTYDIYIGGNDSGEDITVNGSGTKTINFYTVSLTKGTGISAVSSSLNSTGFSPASGVYKSGSSVKLSATVSKGYTFSKWTQTSGGAQVSTTNAYIGTISSTWSYTANATANSYTITYKDCGDTTFSGTHGSGYSQNYTYGVGATLDNATKTNYVFDGYYTTSACSGTAVTSIETTATGNKTYYAKWKANSSSSNECASGKWMWGASYYCNDGKGKTFVRAAKDFTSYSAAKSDMDSKCSSFKYFTQQGACRERGGFKTWDACTVNCQY